MLYQVKYYPVQNRIVDIREYHFKLCVFSQVISISRKVNMGFGHDAFVNFAYSVVRNMERFYNYISYNANIRTMPFDTIPFGEFSPPITYTLSDFDELEADKETNQAGGVVTFGRRDTNVECNDGNNVVIGLLVLVPVNLQQQ